MTIPRLTRYCISSHTHTQKIPSKWQIHFIVWRDSYDWAGTQDLDYLNLRVRPSSFFSQVPGKCMYRAMPNTHTLLLLWNSNLAPSKLGWPRNRIPLTQAGSRKRAWNQNMPSSLLPAFTLGSQMVRKGKSRKSMCKSKGKVRGFLYGLPSVKGGQDESGMVIFSSSSYNSILYATAIALFFI